MTGSGQHWVGPHAAPCSYRLVRLLGRGGEGEVWRAVLPLSEHGQRHVAVKILHSTGEPGEEAAWNRNGHLLQSLSHPGLVRVTDVFVGPPVHRVDEVDGEEPARYVVMDLVEGPTLREWTDENPDATASVRLQMLRTVADALDDMHSGRRTQVAVAHGDVKPSNIIIGPDGETVLADLGLARLVDAVGASGRSRPYAAPELREPGTQATPEADRFAFAVTAAQVVTGEPPPVDEEGFLDVAALEELLRGHDRTRRRHELVRQLLDAVTAPADQRTGRLRQWLDAVADALSQVTDPPLGLATTPELAGSATEPAPARTRRRPLAAWLVVIAVAAVFVGGSGSAATSSGAAASGASAPLAPAGPVLSEPTSAPASTLAPTTGGPTDVAAPGRSAAGGPAASSAGGSPPRAGRAESASGPAAAGPVPAAPAIPAYGPTATVYRVSSQGGAVSHTMRSGGSMDQQFVADVDVVDMIGAIVGFDPTQDQPGPNLIELQLIGGGAVLQSGTLDVVNNRETRLSIPETPVRRGGTYTLRVINRSDEVLGFYVNPPGKPSAPANIAAGGARVRITGDDSRPGAYTHPDSALSGIVEGRSRA